MSFFSQIRYLLSLNMSRMVISWGTLEGAVGWTIHILLTRMLNLKQVWRHSSWWSSLGMWLKEWDICLPKMLVLISSAETFIIRYFWTLRVLCWTSDILRTRMLRLKQVWRHSSWWSSFGMWLKEWDIFLPKMLVLISSAETFIIRYFWMVHVLCWANDTNCNELWDLGSIKYAVSAYPDSCSWLIDVVD